MPTRASPAVASAPAATLAGVPVRKTLRVTATFATPAVAPITARWITARSVLPYGSSGLAPVHCQYPARRAVQAQFLRYLATAGSVRGLIRLGCETLCPV